MTVTEIGKNSPWAALWKALAPGTDVRLVLADGAEFADGAEYVGEFESDASWESLDEETRYHGVVIGDDLAVSHWIPNDAVVSVELL